jgi:hypothetical protein
MLSYVCFVDESRDKSNRDKMAISIHFVDKKWFHSKENFLVIVHVLDTATLKHELSAVLVNHQLDVSKLHGQGYEGASNIFGEWNGLQAKLMEECPYAYYIHYFSPELQLLSLPHLKEYLMFTTLLTISALGVTIVVSSSNRNDELHANQVADMEHLIDLGDLETSSGANQLGTSKRPCVTMRLFANS